MPKEREASKDFVDTPVDLAHLSGDQSWTLGLQEDFQKLQRCFFTVGVAGNASQQRVFVGTVTVSGVTALA